MKRRATPHTAPVHYERDPDFRPHPPARPLSGPGQQLHPLEREVVRRLIIAADQRPSLCLDDLERKLPLGVSLSDAQRGLLDQLLRPSRNQARRSIEALWRLDYTIQPPTLEQFIDDDYYLGTVLRPSKHGKGLWPFWREWLKEHAGLESFLHTLVITGALGMGKTMVTVVMMLYRIALCACLRDPCAFFDLSRGSPIDFLLLSISKDVTRGTAWRDAHNLLKSSRFFREHCGYDHDTPPASLKVELRIRAEDGSEVQLSLSGGSRSADQRGRNVLGVALDESNFRLEADPQQGAANLYADFSARIASRFQCVGAFTPGLSIVVSSAGDETCFTEKLIQQIQRDADPNGQQVVRQALYRVKPPPRPYAWWFRVSYGLANVEPAVLAGCYNEQGQPVPPSPSCPAALAQPHQPAPPGASWELVPGDYYAQYARAPRKCLQEFSGISLGGANRLFHGLVDIERCLELSVQEGVPVPSQADTIVVSEEGSRQIWRDLDRPAFVRPIGSGSCEPVRHPQRRRYAHLDLATSSLAGLAVCHLVDYASPPVGPGGLPLPRLIVEYDFILTLAPARNEKIYFEKIFQFICWLRDVCGFRFGRVTADSYQSHQMLQTLHSRGFDTDLQSVDRDKRAYLAWLGAFQEHCIRLYRQAQLLKEAAELIETEWKIVHPPDGTKDTTDAAAGAYFNAITSDEVESLGGPQGPSALVGISYVGNASPQDPFGFFAKIPARKPRIFSA